MREEEKKRSSQDSSVKRFFKKRWAFPAIYLGSAAILLTAVLWYQSNASNTEDYDYEATDVAEKKFNDPAIEVNRSMENVVMPVIDPMSVVIQKEFYDAKASDEKQEAALVFYDNSYHPNTGIDMTMKDGKSFEVVAALSGKVTKVVDNDALLGNVIEIEHDKGIVTQYQSVSDIKVKVGDVVKQAQPIATAGESLLNEEAGIHVHFEIRKDNVALNPSDYFQKPLSALQEVDVTNVQASEDMNTEATTEESTDASDEKAAEDKATEEEAEKDATEKDPADETGDKKDADKPAGDTDADNSTNTEEIPGGDEGTNAKKSTDA